MAALAKPEPAETTIGERASTLGERGPSCVFEGLVRLFGGGDRGVRQATVALLDSALVETLAESPFRCCTLLLEDRFGATLR
mmetsp:Transcript_55106/g.98339  ORF Transcript_55106/g.98339 Transcript_55106/m.98339 type:complete len:82 (+) Transcript_55106:1226-1471(+)